MAAHSGTCHSTRTKYFFKSTAKYFLFHEINFHILHLNMILFIFLQEDGELIPDAMTNECVAQSWFRFLNCIGNPVELSKPIAVSNTQQFKV